MQTLKDCLKALKESKVANQYPEPSQQTGGPDPLNATTTVEGGSNATNATTTGDAGTTAGNQTVGGPLALYGGGGGGQ